MKKVKIFITASLMAVAVGGAFASINSVTADYYIFPGDNPAGTPQQVQSSLNCPSIGLGCRATYNGVSYQLFIADPEAEHGYSPVKP